MQGYVAGQIAKIGEDDSNLVIPLTSCTQLQHGEVHLGKALQGVRVQICDRVGRVLPPEVPGFLVLESDSLPNGKQPTGLRVSYTWDGALTLLTSQVQDLRKF